MKEFVVMRKEVAYFTQTVVAQSIEEAIAEANEIDQWEFVETETADIYGSEAQ